MSGSHIPSHGGAAVPIGPQRRYLAATSTGTPGPTGLNDPGAPLGASCEMPLGARGEDRFIDAATLFDLPSQRRGVWYASQLGSHQDQLSDASFAHCVPTPLLATTLLDGLVDAPYASFRVGGQTLGGISFTAGKPSGRSTSTADVAVSFGQLDSPGWVESIARHTAKTAGHVASRLRTPEFAIESTAKEIATILSLIPQHLAASHGLELELNPSQFASLAHPSDLYNHVGGSDRKAKERKLAEIVVAVYNSPDYAGAMGAHSRDFSSTVHGMNGSLIAEDLFDLALFR